MSQQEDRAKECLERSFPYGLTAQQIDAVIRFSKLVRFRARSNNALFPLVQRVFGDKFKARFRKKAATNRHGEVYEAWEISIRLPPVEQSGGEMHQPKDDTHLSEDDKEE